MKVMHIITGLNRGGAEGALCRLVLGDEANVHTVVSLMDGGVYGPVLRAAGIHVEELGLARGRMSINGLVRLFRSLRETKPDVVQTWMYHADLLGGLVARAAGVREICWGIRHSDLDPAKTSPKTRLVARLCAELSAFIPRVVVSCARSAVKLHVDLGYDASKFAIVPNGFDCEKLKPNAVERRRVRTEIGATEQQVLLGMVARWDPQKDHRTFLEALAQEPSRQLSNVVGVLIGPGMSEQNIELMSLVDRYGLRSRLKILGPRDDVPALMNAIDLHVLSSAFGEAFPNVIAEAMACGTPCVATDVGDAQLIIGGTGWIVTPRSADALSKTIHEAVFAMRSAAWSERKIACRERIVANYSIERMIRGFTEVWAKTTNPRQAILSEP